MIWKRFYSYAKIKAKLGNLLIKNWDEIKNLEYFELLRLLAQRGYLKYVTSEDFNKPYKIEWNLRFIEAETLLSLRDKYPYPQIIDSSFLLIDLYNLKLVHSRKKEALQYLIPTLNFRPNIIEKLKEGEFSVLKALPFYSDNIKEAELKLLGQYIRIFPKDLQKFLVDMLNIRARLLGLDVYFRGGKLTKEDLESINTVKDVAKYYKQFEGVRDEYDFERRILDYLEKIGWDYSKYSVLDRRPFLAFPILFDIEITKLSSLVAEKYLSKD